MGIADNPISQTIGFLIVAGLIGIIGNNGDRRLEGCAGGVEGVFALFTSRARGARGLGITAMGFADNPILQTSGFLSVAGPIGIIGDNGDGRLEACDGGVEGVFALFAHRAREDHFDSWVRARGFH